jgi:hypothetical protein
MRGMTASVLKGTLGWRLRDTVHRQCSRTLSGSSMVNAWLTPARQPNDLALSGERAPDVILRDDAEDL